MHGDPKIRRYFKNGIQFTQFPFQRSVLLTSVASLLSKMLPKYFTSSESRKVVPRILGSQRPFSFFSKVIPWWFYLNLLKAPFHQISIKSRVRYTAFRGLDQH